MRLAFLCFAAWMIIQETSSATHIGNVGEGPGPLGRFAEGEYFGYPLFFDLVPTMGPLPLEVVLDVNGEEKRIEKETRGRILVEPATGEASFKWFERGIEELIGFSGGSRYKIVSYPIKKLYSRHELGGVAGGQIYTQVFRWVGDGVGDNFGFEPYVNSLRGDSYADTDNASLEWTQPLIIQAIERIDDDRWMLRDVSGPRWVGDVTLFDQVVGGEQFTVRLKEFGFGNFGDILAGRPNVPEPSTWLLLAIALLSAVLFLLRRVSERMPLC